MIPLFLANTQKLAGSTGSQSGAAATPSWELMRDAIRNQQPSDSLGIWWLVLLAGTLVGLLVAARAFRWIRERHLRSKPLRVFHHLANELGLHLADQWLLVRISRQQLLPSPLTLILSSSTLRHHGEQFALTLSSRKQSRVMLHIAGIDAVLFGEN